MPQPDIFDREDLPFPGSLPEFQRLFPNDAACAAYLEAIRWRHGFMCMWCGERGEPFRFANRPHVLRCRKCRKDNALTAGTVMERTHTPLSVWFWAAYLASSLTPGLSAVQFQRQLGIGRYETAFQILHKLRAGMVRPDRDQIGGSTGEHVEVDETWIGGATRGGGKERREAPPGRTLCGSHPSRRDAGSHRTFADELHSGCRGAGHDGHHRCRAELCWTCQEQKEIT